MIGEIIITVAENSIYLKSVLCSIVLTISVSIYLFILLYLVKYVIKNRENKEVSDN